MAPDLTTDLNGVLNSLLGLYGQGSPAPGTAGTVSTTVANMDNSHNGSIARHYSDARGMQVSIAESQAGKDAVVHKAVTAAGDGTVTGRNALNNRIADLQSRLQAIAGVGDLRFSGPAMLNAAHATIADATKQVDADVAAAHRHAATIQPPSAPAPVHRRITPAGRSRRRSRIRTRAGGGGGGGARPSAVRSRPVPSDGTAGGKAVSAASAWLGTPYVWGGGGAGGPSGGGFDCSGLTQYAVAEATDGRVHLPRTTYEQIYCGERISPRDVRPGDLVFPADSFSARGPEHVQLAAGNGMVIEAPYSGATVRWARMPSEAVVVRVM
ncbi:peptidase P60 [Nocardia sp. 852002-20019_SCH5090214]|uniref:Peptidoglycan endopeptidase n=1 Tax=Nocardia nova TaxID=37330 RepID=A0A2S6A3J8_9NOCA|nr:MULTISPECIES: C40 family peptidase [Nocardia]OBF83006.1 peptidase P60 [Mycobacterium sp. 852002-51759_SCH5129042]MBF6278235.1 C40 family peptidase [Nocardia nova]MBV7705859.1 C40 family peptidase [Nocardia nova]OBA51784.1 peptidase P60 [Nocardia sp. 852002-51101_SCH5132738]OBA56399.1 peptidase P60 [Nocardia sp. 852002-20019_SCH5090214]